MMESTLDSHRQPFIWISLVIILFAVGFWLALFHPLFKASADEVTTSQQSCTAQTVTPIVFCLPNDWNIISADQPVILQNSDASESMMVITVPTNHQTLAALARSQIGPNAKELPLQGQFIYIGKSGVDLKLLVAVSDQAQTVFLITLPHQTTVDATEQLIIQHLQLQSGAE